ncbi:MAG: hypothetical protein Q4A96_02270 [Candidatus Saccharibacteria bacterium]|jgi:hypothetical protein|nr:hypothetical protein [Candidatus Saccharibacteria bacterium]
MQKRSLKQSLINLQNELSFNRQKMRKVEAERNLINAESALGRTLFGTVEEGKQREFFCLQKNVWVWYEDGQVIRYEVRQSGVFKKVDNGSYSKISGEELEHFRDATKAYLQLIKLNLYKD